MLRHLHWLVAHSNPFKLVGLQFNKGIEISLNNNYTQKLKYKGKYPYHDTKIFSMALIRRIKLMSFLWG